MESGLLNQRDEAKSAVPPMQIPTERREREESKSPPGVYVRTYGVGGLIIANSFIWKTEVLAVISDGPAAQRGGQTQIRRVWISHASSFPGSLSPPPVEGAKAVRLIWEPPECPRASPLCMQTCLRTVHDDGHHAPTGVMRSAMAARQTGHSSTRTEHASHVTLCLHGKNVVERAAS